MLSLSKHSQDRMDAIKSSCLKIARSYDWKGAMLGARFDSGAHHGSLSAEAREICRGFQRQDAAESIWFARQLEYIRPGLLEVLYPRLEAKSLIPVDSSMGAGATQWTYRAFDKVGLAALVEDYSMDPPRADVLGKESTVNIRPYGIMYGYNFQELKAGMMANLPLDVRKAMAARYAMELKIDQILFYGDSSAGLLGLLTQTGTTSFTVPNGASGSTLWANKSADEIAADMHNFVNNVVSSSFGVYQPTTLLLPLQAHNIAATKRMGDGSNQTVLSFFLDTNPFIQEVRPSYRLDYTQSANWGGNGAAGSGRMVCYDKSPEMLTAILPVEFEQLPPQQVGYEYKTLCHMRTGGVAALHPLSLSYGDGIS